MPIHYSTSSTPSSSSSKRSRSHSNGNNNNNNNKKNKTSTKTKMNSLHSNNNNNQEELESNLQAAGDVGNVMLLLLLYFLQGIPMGLSATLDLSLQEGGKVSLEEQGIFNLVGWPYSLKMLWAPIVDSVFLVSFGRRKSWLIPCQILIGCLLIFSAHSVEDYLQEKKIIPLTVIFFMFYLLAATQDIAVDGWALEILAKRNLGWASTCNSVGLTAGFYCSFTGFMALRTYDLCTLPTFMIVSGTAFLLTTLLLAIFKKEAAQPNNVLEMSIMDSYRSMIRVMQLPSVQSLALILFTRAMAFAAVDTLSSRKLLGAGMKKESLASLMVIMTPVQVIIPGLIAPYTAKNPLSLFISVFPIRLVLVGCTMYFVATAPDFSTINDELPMTFYGSLVLLTLIGSILGTIQFVSLMAFFAKISDPAVGGTFMTLLNTVTNLGNKWPNTLVLFFVNYCNITWPIELDGYYVVGCVSLCIGVIWYRIFSQRAMALEKLKDTKWRVV
jgi:PAT family acetyl-CoA transporter-like MFS transporter 1